MKYCYAHLASTFIKELVKNVDIVEESKKKNLNNEAPVSVQGCQQN